MENKERQAIWYKIHKDEFKQRNVRLPKELNDQLNKSLKAQNKTFQSWINEQAEILIKQS